jgi:hypothetical protein
MARQESVADHNPLVQLSVLALNVVQIIHQAGGSTGDSRSLVDSWSSSSDHCVSTKLWGSQISMEATSWISVRIRSNNMCIRSDVAVICGSAGEVSPLID